MHIHTVDPAALIGIAAQRGGLSNLEVEDMTAQHHEILERAARTEAAAPAGPEALVAGHAAVRGPAARLGATVSPQAAAPSRRFAVVAVAPGDGFREIFRSLGADAVVDGGQTMNPSTKDLLAAVRATGAASVVILPNNGNVIMTAEQVQHSPRASTCGSPRHAMSRRASAPCWPSTRAGTAGQRPPDDRGDAAGLGRRGDPSGA